MSNQFTKLSRRILAEETQKIVDIYRDRIIRNTERRLKQMGEGVDLDAAEASMAMASAVSRESSES